MAAQIISTFVAVVALFIGLRNETRNQRRFQLQLDQSRRVAEAANKPLLSVEYEKYEDEKAVTLHNRGPGTAIVTSLVFHRGSKKSTDMSDLILLDKEIDWIEAGEFATPFYMEGGSNQDALRINADRLTECGIAGAAQQELLDDIEQQVDDVGIAIKYEDVFGTKYECSQLA